MTKVSRVFMAILISSIATASYAVKLEVMPTVGKAYKTGGDSLKDDEILYGVRGTVFLNNEVAVQAALETSKDNLVGNEGAKTDIERVSANIIYEKDTGKRVRPYAMIGVGNESTHGITAPTTGDGSQGFINVGAGLKFGITKRVDLVTEARWLRKLTNDDNDIVATVGLGVNTGSSTKTASKIPSVTETSDVQNAINLAELRKITEKKSAEAKKINNVKESVTTIAPAATVVSQSVPAEAIIIDEDATVDDSNEATAIEEAPVAQEGYYVQMAALFKGRGESLTNRLEQKDYPYVLHNVEKNGKEATLVLVGPYESRVEASIAMKYLRRLKSDAFIYHMN